MPIQAAPIVVAPSGQFLGIDGAWSTFLVNAGTPPQQVHVLASTEVNSAWLVAPDGCGPNDAVNCTTMRGGIYDDTKSSTWNPNGLFQLGYENNLGYTGNAVNGSYGYDTLEIPGQPGGANISVDHQVLAGIVTEDFFLGSLGLSSQDVNFTSTDDSSPSFLTSLKNKNLIPSLSYGYTAGASYQQSNGVNGSLTLGGYDASRLTPNDVSFTFAPATTRQLVVALQSITYSNSKTETSLLSQGVLALLDSTVPYMWLPQSACEAFETAFGISWDSIHNLYLVNDTLHDALVKDNASVIFELSNSINGNPSVNITLPYASFDLIVDYPLVKNQSRYFPLQRAADDSSYTLGRAFFQESFLIVNYEHANFSVSQALHDVSAPAHIVALASTSTETTGSTSSNPSSTSTTSPTIVKTIDKSSHKVGTGAIAGIAVAVVLIGLLVGLIFFFKQRTKRRQSQKPVASKDQEAGGMVFEVENKAYYSEEPEVKKATEITVRPVVMTPPESSPYQKEFFAPDAEKGPIQGHKIELPGSPVNRSELSSPEPWSWRELPSPDPEALRSELSTPDPMYSNTELPSPDPRHELASPPASDGSPSPDPEHRRSGLRAPQQLPAQRPLSERYDSSESEVGMTRIPSFHPRFHSDDSDVPTLQSFRPRHSRMDSSDSESGDLDHANRPALISPISHLDPSHIDSSDSEAVSAPSYSTVRRSRNARLDSSDSEGGVSPHSASSSSTHHIRGLSRTFHGSSSSRPAISSLPASVPRPALRHSNPWPGSRRPASQRIDESDSEAWQTRLDSPSTEATSDMSRYNSVREQSGKDGQAGP